MQNTLVFGHKNPDTDTVCSALIYSMGELKKGNAVDAKTLGAINKETEFVLNELRMESLPIIDSINDGQKVVLVDHNEFKQSVNNIDNAEIIAVYDHHRINDFKTKNPIVMDIRPLGCTATILYDKFTKEGVEFDDEMKILVISAIISDSLLFTSPTCTELDKETALKIAREIDMDIYDYGRKMLEAGANLKGFSTTELLNVDSKEFEVDGKKIQISQINTLNIDEIIESRNAELITEMNKTIVSKKLYTFIFIITDIINSNSKALILGKNPDEVAKKLNKTLKNNIIDLPGVVSRKKQIVPFL